MKIRNRLLGAVMLAVLPGWLAPPLAAQAPQTEYEGSAAVGLALRRLGVSKRVLMIGAHPDDESTQILSTLALGDGAQVAYLSLTRGEGGQNGIGPELQEGLGLLRSEELLAARRLDGARQYFTRAYDYGFSKDAAEAFRHWPRELLLADVVAAVRDFRPDLLVSIFSGTPRDGHGQHMAAGLLAREAWETAGPGPVKLFQALWWRDEGATDSLRTGTLDPLLGRSHYQVAMAARSRHRSQDMGQILEPGPHASAFRLLESRVAETGGLFAGVDTLLSERAEGPAAATLARYEAAVAAARGRFNPLRPAAIVPELAAALGLLRQAAATAGADPELRVRLRDEEAELADALWRAAGLSLDAVAADETVVPGQTLELTLRLWNGGERPVRVATLEPALPAGWSAEPVDPAPAALAPGALAERRFRVAVPADAALSEPYFLRAPRSGDVYAWPAEAGGVGTPFAPDAVRARGAVEVEGAAVAATRDADFLSLDKMSGEVRRPVRVVPAVALTVSPELAILPTGGASEMRTIPLTVRLRAEQPGGIAGALRPILPAGWRARPESVELRFAAAGEERAVEIELLPPAGVREGTAEVGVVFQAADGRRFDRGFELIDYPHIRPRPLPRAAVATVRALDVRVPTGLRVGYVAGPGDEVPAALAQLGIPVEPLGPEQLATADLSGFDVIVTGIRAYEVRPDLVAHNARLLEYVRGGGTAIVQYNKYEYTEPGIAPYPVSMSRPHGRVTDEAAPVRLLAPEHPVLSAPNRLSAEDFEGWVQERGLYFASEWDPAYTPLLEMADPGEDPLRGSLLVAEYGEGTYVYTGLALFRQLPAGVPGAYRLFANLLALGEGR